jgi:lactoylglutathione lyase
LTLPGGGARIELMSIPGVEDAPPWAVGWDHIAVSLGTAESVDRLARRCNAAGLLVSAPRMTGDGYYEAVVAMPDGTRIEITA